MFSKSQNVWATWSYHWCFWSATHCLSIKCSVLLFFLKKKVCTLESTAQLYKSLIKILVEKRNYFLFFKFLSPSKAEVQTSLTPRCAGENKTRSRANRRARYAKGRCPQWKAATKAHLRSSSKPDCICLSGSVLLHYGNGIVSPIRGPPVTSSPQTRPHRTQPDRLRDKHCQVVQSWLRVMLARSPPQQQGSHLDWVFQTSG